MIAIIDYKAGNLFSVRNALRHLGYNCVITNDAQKILAAEKVIFPGVGSAGTAIKVLKEHNLDTVLAKITAPFLGICLGMQLLFDYSEENRTKCLSIIPGKVIRFSENYMLKIPEMGWNAVDFIKNDPLLKGIEDGATFYFVHSFYSKTAARFALGFTLYGSYFPSIVKKDNFYGVQFHPEKSGEKGLQLLANFCGLC